MDTDSDDSIQILEVIPPKTDIPSPLVKTETTWTPRQPMTSLLRPQLKPTPWKREVKVRSKAVDNDGIFTRLRQTFHMQIKNRSKKPTRHVLNLYVHGGGQTIIRGDPVDSLPKERTVVKTYKHDKDFFMDKYKRKREMKKKILMMEEENRSRQSSQSEAKSCRQSSRSEAKKSRQSSRSEANNLPNTPRIVVQSKNRVVKEHNYNRSYGH